MKGDFTYQFDYAAVTIEKGEIFDLIQLPSLLQISLSPTINEVLENLSGFKNIKGGFTLKETRAISAKDESIAIEDLTFQVGNSINFFLRNSQFVAVFICTAGFEIEKLSSLFKKKGDLLKSYICDLVGNLLVEKAMNLIQKELGAMAISKGYFLTNRYSPGYCEWNVADQHKLFSLLPTGFCNVTLNSSSLMSPMKSISGIIGIGKKVKFHKHSCGTCKSIHCSYRVKMYVNH